MSLELKACSDLFCLLLHREMLKANQNGKRQWTNKSSPSAAPVPSILSKIKKDRKNVSKLFYGGSAYDWMVSKNKVRDAFIENGCWSYIQPAPLAVAIVAGAVGVPAGAAAPIPAVVAAIVEDIFVIPRPIATDDAAEAIINNMRQELIDVYDLNDVAINALPGAVMNANGRALALHNSMCERRKEIVRVENTREIVLTRLVNSVVQWEKDRKLHEDKVACCLKVFNSTMGPSPLAVIRAELSELRFRAAWAKLNAHYSTSVGGQQNVSDVLSLMNNAVFYENRKTISEHIEDMLTLANEVSLFHADPLSPPVVLDYILNSIERSECKDFEKDLEDIRRRDVDLVEARRLFQKTESRKLTKDVVEKQQQKKQKVHANANAVVESPTRRESALVKAAALLMQHASPTKNPYASYVCKTCKKTGHSEEKCWLNAECHKCKKVGHLAKFCPDDATTDSSKSPKKVTITELFNGKK